MSVLLSAAGNTPSRAAEAWTAHSAAEDPQLMTQIEQLDVLVRVVLGASQRRSS
jgi:hypothetical protein